MRTRFWFSRGSHSQCCILFLNREDPQHLLLRFSRTRETTHGHHANCELGEGRHGLSTVSHHEERESLLLTQHCKAWWVLKKPVLKCPCYTHEPGLELSSEGGKSVIGRQYVQTPKRRSQEEEQLWSVFPLLPLSQERSIKSQLPTQLQHPLGSCLKISILCGWRESLRAFQRSMRLKSFS